MSSNTQMQPEEEVAKELDIDVDTLRMFLKQDDIPAMTFALSVRLMRYKLQMEEAEKENG